MRFKKITIVAIGLMALLIGCMGEKSVENKSDTTETVVKEKTPEFLPLHVIYVTHEGSGENKTRTDSVGVYWYRYLEISLSLMTDGGLGANGSAPFSESDKKTTVRFSDEKGNELRFGNSNEFLNFVADRGYEFIDQSRARYENNYIFRRIDANN